MAHLTSSEISFTKSLDDLPPDLRAETDRILKALGNDNFTHAIRMPRRLMRHLMTSPRLRPVRGAVILGMLLRIMMTKRGGWYRGCLSTTLLVDISGFHESRIKHERTALVREHLFERLDTPARVRQLHGDWYSLAQHLPVSSVLQNGPDRQPPEPTKNACRQPPFRKPVPSVGIDRNQFLDSKPGASSIFTILRPTAGPRWHCITTLDFQVPWRRAALYEDACSHSVIGRSPAGKLTFYAAMARARRLGTVNPCGMLRSIVEKTPYRRHIASFDEDQARVWLSAEDSPDLDTAEAGDLLRRLLKSAARHQPLGQVDESTPSSTPPEFPATGQPEDSIIAGYFQNRLQEAGFPNDNAFNLIMTTDEGRKKLEGWTQDRWNQATSAGSYTTRSTNVK